MRIEVGIDCREPERLAPFWAAALGYRVGDLDEAMIYLDLIPPDPSLPGVYLQRVPDEKIVKNRVHLDLYSASPETVIEYLSTLGASSIGVPQA
ncbi:MAG: VOC family protein, partial [Acidimicrobiales bacterium]